MVATLETEEDSFQNNVKALWFPIGLHYIYVDNGKENGNYYNGLYGDHIGVILGSYGDNGKENGN